MLRLQVSDRTQILNLAESKRTDWPGAGYPNQCLQAGTLVLDASAVPMIACLFAQLLGDAREHDCGAGLLHEEW